MTAMRPSMATPLPGTLELRGQATASSSCRLG